MQNTITVQVPVLPEQEADLILKRWLTVNNRQLKEKQTEEVLTKFKHTKLPIYLKLAFERAKHWHSYDTNIELQSDVKGILNDFFQYLEDEHTEEFVRAVICYLLCGKYQGLAENEILEILVFDKDYWKIFFERTHEDHRKELEDVTKIPIVVWSRLFHDLEPFLTERDADGVLIVTFFHKQFNEVLKERYKLVEEEVNN